MKKNEIVIPADVPQSMQEQFIKNYEAITHGAGKLMLFTGDQKIEHMNEDFYGKGIPPEVNHPKHLFEIAQHGRIGAFATQLGLIARYGKEYPDVNYIVKANAKTNLLPTEEEDPISYQCWSVESIMKFKEDSGLQVRGIGHTVYLGSKYEWYMLPQAAQQVTAAHRHGLVAILWIYPRGKFVHYPKDADTVAGAAGVGAALGADFVKVTPPVPKPGQPDEAELLQQATQAAGNTKVLCSGGACKNPEKFLQELYDQIHTGHVGGNATGRNIFQHPTKEAIAMTKAISKIVLDGKSVKEALKEL